MKRKLPEEVLAMPEEPKAVLCFSSVYYNVTDTKGPRTYSTALSSTTVLMANGQSIDVNIHLDTCGSRNLAKSREPKNTSITKYTWLQLTEIVRHIIAWANYTSSMKIKTPSSRYVTCKQPIKGIDNFVLISNSTLVAIQTDLNYHSSMCELVGIVPLRRLVSQPYHYSDKVKHVWLNDSDTIVHTKQGDQVTENQNIPVNNGDAAMLAVNETETEPISIDSPDTCQCACQPRLAEQLCEVDFLTYPPHPKPL